MNGCLADSLSLSGCRPGAGRALFAVALIAILCLCGCAREEKSDPRSKTQLVTIEGSDTMSQLVKAWSQAFMKTGDIPVSVTAADSGEGIKALIEGTTDIAAASRDLTAAEQKLIHARDIHVERKIVALDAIAVIINKDNPVDEITIPQLAGLFSGKIKNWSDVSVDASGEPVIFRREQTSGTCRYFLQHVISRPSSETAGAEVSPGSYVDSAKIVTSNQAMIAGIASEKEAIGYVGLGYADAAQDRIKILKLKLLSDSPSTMPSESESTTDYPLSRPLYLFVEKSAKENARKFIDFCASPEGQAIVRKQGFVAVSGQ